MSRTPCRTPAGSGRLGGRRSASKSSLKRRGSLVLRSALEGITKNDIKRLARRGGVLRIGNDCYGEVRGALNGFLCRFIPQLITLAEYAQRYTVTSNDVSYALKQNGITMYGEKMDWTYGFYSKTYVRKKVMKPVPAALLAAAAAARAASQAASCGDHARAAEQAMQAASEQAAAEQAAAGQAAADQAMQAAAEQAMQAAAAGEQAGEDGAVPGAAAAEADEEGEEESVAVATSVARTSHEMRALWRDEEEEEEQEEEEQEEQYMDVQQQQDVGVQEGGEQQEGEEERAAAAAAAAPSFLSPLAQQQREREGATAAGKGSAADAAGGDDRRLSNVPTPAIQPMSKARCIEIQGWLSDILHGPLSKEGYVPLTDLKRVLLARHTVSAAEVQDVLFVLEKNGSLMFDDAQGECNVYLCN